MRRVLELVFRHWAKILGLLIIPVIIALAIVLVQPRQYEASTTLWALQRYSVIGATGPEANLYATPASTQATALTDLLQTRTFDLAIAQETDLAKTFDAATRADTNNLDDAIVKELSTKVIPVAVGTFLYQITYDNKSPKIAKQVISAVVDQFAVAATGFSVVEAKQLLQIYGNELTQAQTSANAATQAAADYVNAHPRATAQTDPIYNQLLQQVQGAQANVASLQGHITTLNQQLATNGGSASLYKVVDAPLVSNQPISRTKTIELGGGIGLAVALLAITLLLVAFSRRDRSVYSLDDLHRIIGIPVALELPELLAAVAFEAEARFTLGERVGVRS